MHMYTVVFVFDIILTRYLSLSSFNVHALEFGSTQTKQTKLTVFKFLLCKSYFGFACLSLPQVCIWLLPIL